MDAAEKALKTSSFIIIYCFALITCLVGYIKIPATLQTKK